MEKQFKVFGAALDASDLPLSIQMKHAYLNRLINNYIEKPNFLDPYDAFLELSQVAPKKNIIKLGKFPIESWLTPKPFIDDLSRINKDEFHNFTNENHIRVYSERMADYVKKNVLPDIPLMIGVDHSLTGGVLSAISEEIGPEKLHVIILDAHFDGLPTSIAINIAKYANEHPHLINPLMPESCFFYEDINDTYKCGSFLKYLLDENVILAENLIIFGCQDYPDEEIRSLDDPRIKEYIRFYDTIELSGVAFIPKEDPKRMLEKLKNILEKISNSNIYISFDVDVAAFKDVIATRFLNLIGIDRSVLIETADIINKNIESNSNNLIGLDLMEIEIHLLNKGFPESGRRDKTIKLLDKFLDFFIM